MSNENLWGPEPDMDPAVIGAKLVGEATTEELMIALAHRCDTLVAYGFESVPHMPEAIKHLPLLKGDVTLMLGGVRSLSLFADRMWTDERAEEEGQEDDS